MENEGLWVNMGKTKLMVSGSNLDVSKKSEKYPCGVYRVFMIHNFEACCSQNKNYTMNIPTIS